MFAAGSLLVINLDDSESFCANNDDFDADNFFVHLCIGVHTEEECDALAAINADAGFHWHVDNEECRGRPTDLAAEGAWWFLKWYSVFGKPNNKRKCWYRITVGKTSSWTWTSACTPKRGATPLQVIKLEVFKISIFVCTCVELFRFATGMMHDLCCIVDVFLESKMLYFLSYSFVYVWIARKLPPRVLHRAPRTYVMCENASLSFWIVKTIPRWCLNI